MSTELWDPQIETCNSWIVEDVASGKLTEDQANSIGREANSDFKDDAPVQTDPLFPGDIPSASSYAAYRFPLHQAPDEGEATARAADLALRHFIHAAGFDPARGSQFGKAINESVQQSRHRSQLDNDLQGNREFKKLGWDEATWESRAPAIREFINRVEAKKPGFKALLNKTGAYDNATISLLLYTQSEIERERKVWHRTTG